MTGLIILAAGESSRLGFPKQTLLYKGRTLLEHAIEAGLQSKCSTVTVVTGAHAAAIENSIKRYDIHILHNPSWAEGMESSIKIAIQNIHQDIDQTVIMLCDQPFVTRAVIDNLLDQQQATGKKIIASSYKHTIGVPALFHRSLFNELLLLQGQEGAKKVLHHHPNDLDTISFEKGSIDIDTLADYEHLLNNA